MGNFLEKSWRNTWKRIDFFSKNPLELAFLGLRKDPVVGVFAGGLGPEVSMAEVVCLGPMGPEVWGWRYHEFAVEFIDDCDRLTIISW